MYLDRRAIDATLEVIARRSTAGSRLVVLYHRPALRVSAVAMILRRIGEPLRSSFRPEAMRSLLDAHGFDVVRDRSLPEIGRTMTAAVAKAAQLAKHLRIVTAERRSSRPSGGSAA